MKSSPYIIELCGGRYDGVREQCDMFPLSTCFEMSDPDLRLSGGFAAHNRAKVGTLQPKKHANWLKSLRSWFRTGWWRATVCTLRPPCEVAPSNSCSGGVLHSSKSDFRVAAHSLFYQHSKTTVTFIDDLPVVTLYYCHNRAKVGTLQPRKHVNWLKSLRGWWLCATVRTLRPPCEVAQPNSRSEGVLHSSK